MSLKLVPLSLFCLSVSGLSAFAAASAEEAARIKASLQAYIGSEPGVVDVVAQGDDYAVTIDIMPYVNKGDTTKFTAKIDPWKFLTRPLGNGEWQLSSSGPYNISMSVPEQGSSFSMSLATHEWSAVFNEAMGIYSSSKWKIGGLVFNQEIVDPTTNVKTRGVSSVESMEGGGSATANATGGVDTKSIYNVGNSVTAASNEVPADLAAAGFPALNYTYTAPTTVTALNSSGLRAKPLLELLAWFVARPSREAIIKDQAQLKEKLLAALPLFENLNTTAELNNLSVTTDIGLFSASKLSVGVDINGAVKAGRFKEVLSLSGFKMPPGLVPPWTAELVPTDMTIGFDFSGYDAEAPTKMFIQQMDVSKDEPIPPGSETLYLPAFLPTNAVRVDFPPGQLKSPVYDLTFDGGADVSLQGAFAGKFNFKMAGIDDLIAKVQAAAAQDAMAQQALSVIILAKGLGKTEADGSTSWAVEVTPDLKILVNGNDVSAMAGGGAPAQ